MKSLTITGRNPQSGQSMRVRVEQGCIAAIETGPADEVAWLSPSFVDLQVNGYCGCDLNADQVNAEVVIALVHRMLATGTTTFLPTIVTASEEKIIRALGAIAEARRANSLVAHVIPFVHLEGPFICAEDGAVGAHNREFVRAPSLAEFSRWQAACGDLVGLVTLSPHWKEAPEFIRAITGNGVHVAIGHTHATPQEIYAATDAGATLSTHLGNGIGQIQPRHPNPIWTQLAEDRLTACFIADGHHLPAETLKVMLRAKGIERSILVSDVVALGGMPPGIYDAPVGGPVEVSSDGRIGSVHGGFLAGAALVLKDEIGWITQNSVCELGDAMQMATENPGRIVGDRGVLRVGAKADLIRFNLENEKKSMQIERVLVEGVDAEDQV